MFLFISCKNPFGLCGAFPVTTRRIMAYSVTTTVSLLFGYEILLYFFHKNKKKLILSVVPIMME